MTLLREVHETRFWHHNVSHTSFPRLPLRQNGVGGGALARLLVGAEALRGVQSVHDPGKAELA